MAIEYWRFWQVAVLWVGTAIVELFLYAMVVEDALSSIGPAARWVAAGVFALVLLGLLALTHRWWRTRVSLDRRTTERRRVPGRREDDL